jgi:hypothetical protein
MEWWKELTVRVQFSFGNNMREIKKFKTKYQRCSPMARYV